MGGFGSKSQSWEVTDDKKAAEEIPGAPTEHVVSNTWYSCTSIPSGCMLFS